MNRTSSLVAAWALCVACTPSQPGIHHVERPAASSSSPAAESPSLSPPALTPPSATPPTATPPSAMPIPTPPVPPPSRAPTTSSHPLGHCTGEVFESGWVTLLCGDLALQIYAGFAAGPAATFLREVTKDRLDTLESHDVALTIAGKRVGGWEMTARERAVVEGFVDVERRWDSNGRPTRRALFAKITAPRSGSVGVVCHASADRYDRTRCHAVLEMIAKHDLPTGPITDKSLVLAGIRFSTRGARCWAPEPRAAYCVMQSGMAWTRGDATSARAWIEQRIRDAPLSPHAANGDPAYRVERHPARCVVAGTERDCERVDYFGLIDRVAQRHHYAIVEHGATSTAFECVETATSSPSVLCQQVFGSFVK